MGFWNNELKRDAAKQPAPAARKLRGPIPIQALNKLGCSACPRDKFKLDSPKMEAQGDEHGLLYFLGAAPTFREDEQGEHWVGPAGKAIARLLPNRIFDLSRFGTIVQCGTEDPSDTTLNQHELECCRGRVVGDIERTAPRIVVTVGDDVLEWATGLKSALTWRGSLIPARFGSHVCWVFPLIYPNYTNKRSYNKSEYEMVMERDVADLIDRLDAQPPKHFHDKGPFDAGIEYITGNEPGDMGKLESALHWLTTCGAHGLDYETTGIRPALLKDPAIISVAAGTFERTIAFPVMHPEGWGTEQRMKKVLGMVGEYIAQSGKKRCHNLGFEMDWTRHEFGEEVLRRTEWDDTMAMGYALDERQGTKALDMQTRLEFGFFLKDQSRVDVSLPEWWTRFPLKEILRYNGMDSKWTDLLARERQMDFLFDGRAHEIYQRLLRTVPTLVLTTARGMPVDLDYAEDLQRNYRAQLGQIEHRLRSLPEIRRYTAEYGTFSATNDTHVLTLMQKVLKRPEIKVEVGWGENKTFKYTTGEEVLSLMPPSEVPSAPLIVEHRELTRNDSTYLGPLLEGKLTGPDGMIHEDYDQMRAVSGRLSSRIHNWPKRKHKEVRGAIAVDEGEWFVACDQGQIEFRVAGMCSEDPNIVKYCWTGYDVHAYWAQRMLDEYPAIKDFVVEFVGVDWDEGGFKALRQEAKNGWVFPQLFGSTTESCAARLHLPDDVAKQLGDEYWDEFRVHKKWQRKLLEGYAKNCYVETLGGWRRRGATTSNEAINHPIQGTAAELVVGAFNALSERSQLEHNVEIHPVFNGHDDLSFVMRDERLEDNITIITAEMCKPRHDYVIVPLIVEVSVGVRWNELKEIAKVSGEKVYNLRNPYR